MPTNPFSQALEKAKGQAGIRSFSQPTQAPSPASSNRPRQSSPSAPSAPTRQAPLPAQGGAPNYVSNFNGNVMVQPYNATQHSYHLRAVTPDAQRRANQAGMLILQGKVGSAPGMCSMTVMDAMVAAGIPVPERANANGLDEKLEAQGFVRVEDGNYQPGDIVGWNHYGTNQNSRGWKYGHVGIVTNAGQGRPVVRNQTPPAEDHPATTQLQRLRAQIGKTLNLTTEDLDATRESVSFNRDFARRQAFDDRVEEQQGQFADFLKGLMPEELGSIIDMLYR